MGLGSTLLEGLHLVDAVTDGNLGATLLDELGTLLTLGDGLTDGVVELVLVGLLEGGNLTTALGGLSSVGLHDTGQVLDLLVSLSVVLLHDNTEVVDLLAELGLGLADLVDGIETHATGGGSHSGVLLGLHSLVLPESGPDTTSGLLELVLSVLAVLRELATDGGKSLIERHGHTVELAVGLSLTLLDELLELDVVLKVLLVTLVTELDHATHLSVHVGVHLSLGGAVGAHDTGGGVNPVVHLGHLLLHGGRKEETDLKLSLGCS